MKLHELRELIRNVIVEATEDDVEKALKVFDDQCVDDTKKVGSKLIFDLPEFPLELSFAKAWSNTKPWIVSVMGQHGMEIKGSAKNPIEQRKLARALYEKHLRKTFGVKKIVEPKKQLDSDDLTARDALNNLQHAAKVQRSFQDDRPLGGKRRR